MSVVYLPSANTRPIAMPATGALIGTPASISDSVEPHTDAIDVEPFDAQHVGDDAQRVGPLELRRHDRQRAPARRARRDRSRDASASRPVPSRPWRTAGSCSGACSACVSSSVIVSSICSMRGMPSVSDRRAPASRPAGRGRCRAPSARMPTSADSGRMSVGAATVDAHALVDDAAARDFLLQRAERRLTAVPRRRACRRSRRCRRGRCSSRPRISSRRSLRSVLSAIAIASAVSLARARRTAVVDVAGVVDRRRVLDRLDRAAALG